MTYEYAIGTDFVFKGLMLTSIDYKELPSGYEHKGYTYKNPISVSEQTGGNEEAELKDHDITEEEYQKHKAAFCNEATFLYRVAFVSGEDRDGKREWVGERLTKEEAKAQFDKDHPGCTPLFFIHGFNTEMGYNLNSVQNDAQPKFDEKNKTSEVKTVVVPIVWPSAGRGLAYFQDRYDNVPKAAEELSAMLPKSIDLNMFQEKNLMAHSMGNWLMRKVANPVLKFQNIIMVAADVRHNLYDTKYIESDADDATDGLNIIGMLDRDSETNEPKGKIYCVHHWGDVRLRQSRIVNRVTRAGSAGIGTRDKFGPGWTDAPENLHPEIRGYTENYDVREELKKAKEDKGEHSYQFFDFAIDYYKDVCKV